MQKEPVALVTGANKGIGLQIAKDLAAHGFTVLIGSRNLEQGSRQWRASARMPAPSSSTSRNSLQEMEAGQPSVVCPDEVRTVFETNVFGVIAVTQAMATMPQRREGRICQYLSMSS